MSGTDDGSPRSIEGEDFGGATVWGVNFSGASFEDVNFSGASMRRVWLRDVSVDGFVEKLVVNGVDVTATVNAGDPWWPLRGMLRPSDAAGHRATWAALRDKWDGTLADFSAAGGDAPLASVGGEWSLRDTLRHLIFVTDKWLFAPLTGAASFTRLGLSNTGSKNFPWPGVDPHLDPTWDETLAAFNERCRRVAAFFDGFDPGSLPGEVEVLENGMVPGVECCYAVFEEEFEHLRYAVRDLDALRRGSRP